MKRFTLLAALCFFFCAAPDARAIRIVAPGLWVDAPIVIGGPSSYAYPPLYQQVCGPPRLPPPPPPRDYWGPHRGGRRHGAYGRQNYYGPPPPPPPHFGPPPGSRGHASPPPYYRVW